MDRFIAERDGDAVEVGTEPIEMDLRLGIVLLPAFGYTRPSVWVRMAEWARAKTGCPECGGMLEVMDARISEINPNKILIVGMPPIDRRERSARVVSCAACEYVREVRTVDEQLDINMESEH